jgi:hypothetical protein
MDSNQQRREIPFSTRQDVARLSRDRKVALFGAGTIAEKTERLLESEKLVAIIDNASNLWGESELGVSIQGPERLESNAAGDLFVIITTTSFAEVAAQLEEIGLKPQQDFLVSPVLNDLRIISELESIERKLLFSSGSPKQDHPLWGGGLYELTVKGDTWEHEKKLSGNCYGVISMGDHFITVDTERGIFEFDRDYEIVRSGEIPSGSRAHGVSYSEEQEEFFVVCSNLDQILILNADFGVKEHIKLSGKQGRYKKAFHHCNDCWVKDSSLYVSMFSLTGNWKNDVFDGGVLEIDIQTRSIVGPVMRDLWMPHNVCYLNGGLAVLDSLPGYLRANNAQIIGDFPAFTRGLAHDGVFHYIGQSRNRNYSKNLGISKNISIDAGIIVFDEFTKASRFLQLPPKVSEIHSIKVLA